MSAKRSYIRDGAEIYSNSFAIIRAEANLERFSGRAEKVVVRMIHAAGMVDLADDVAMSDDFADAAVAALRGGAPILCDAQMVAHGVTRSRLPAANQVICTLGDTSVPELAREQETTRSAAALELWRPHLQNAVVAIGNAPTALFRLLELIEQGAGTTGRRDRRPRRVRRRRRIQGGARCRRRGAVLDRAWAQGR